MASIKTGAIVVSWGSAIPAREQRARAVLADVLGFAGRLHNAGRVDEVRLFSAATGTNRETLMLSGALDELAVLLVDDQLEAHVQDLMMVVSNLDIALWAGGSPESLRGGLELHARKLVDHGLV